MRILSLSLLAAVVAVMSCSKAKPTYRGCRIKEVKQTADDPALPGEFNFQFIYNDEGRVQQITKYIREGNRISSNIQLFRYAASNIAIAYLDNNQVRSMDSMELDAQGRVSKIFFGRGKDNIYSGWREYIYDAEGQIVQLRHHAGPSLSVDSATWDNGNIVRYKRDGWGASELFNYYDTLYNTGIINASLSDLVAYGRAIFPVNKLEKGKYSAGYTQYERTYRLDTDGKILEMVEVIPGKRTTTWKLIYDCR